MFPDFIKLGLFALLLVMAVPWRLQAEEVKLIPGLIVKEEFNDNIFLAAGAGQSDFITTLNPSLEFTVASERGSATLSSGGSLLGYARHSGLDSADYSVRGSLGYRIDPRLLVSSAASYVRDSRPDRVDDNGLALSAGSVRQNYQLSLNYSVSEKCTAGVTYDYTGEEFDSSRFLGTRVHSASFSQAYDLDPYLPQARLVASFGYSRNITDISRVDNYTATVGIARRFHELWGFSLNAGGRYTHSAFDQVNQAGESTEIGSDDRGWVGSLSVNYNGESTSASLTFNRDITSASGRAGSTSRTGVSATLGQRFSRELSASLGMGYFMNSSSQFANRSIDENNLNVSCALRYDFSERAALEGAYRYTGIEQVSSGTNARQSVFILQMTLRLDLLDI